MSEEETKDLSGASKFEDRLFRELAAISGGVTAFGTELVAIRGEIAKLDARLTAVENRLNAVENRLGLLEDRVEARLVETRPIWEAVQVSIRRLDHKFDSVIQDLYEMRTDVRLHDKLLTEHERRLNP